jgi:hypothetical protein
MPATLPDSAASLLALAAVNKSGAEMASEPATLTRRVPALTQRVLAMPQLPDPDRTIAGRYAPRGYPGVTTYWRR